jgi:eukaryotic-like serine/threonine-protein kinase
VSAAALLLGRYRLTDLLGAGGAGTVHAAWDEQAQCEVAIKRLPLGHDNTAWQREAALAARLSDPGLVAVRDSFELDGHAHLVMDRVPGQTLKARLAQGPVSADEARDWTRQIAQAVGAAHAQGVVHGDLKPSNLMLEPGGRLRVLDFGVARLIDPLATLTQGDAAASSGTLAYMAPEQLRGQRASVASDVYALGLVLFELLHGTDAFGGQTGLALAYEKMYGTTQSGLAMGARGLDRLVAQMTARDPTGRPADMAAVVQALDGAVEQAAGAVQGPAPTRAGRWWAAGLAATVALAGTAWYLQAPHRTGVTPPALLSTAQTLQQLAQAEALLHDYDDPPSLAQADQLLSAIVAQQPQHAPALALLAIARCLSYFEGSKDPALLKQAQALSEAALKLDSQLAQGYTALGLARRPLGDWPAAEAAFKKALLLNPTEWVAQWGYALALIRSNRLQEAHSLLGAALASHPQERLFQDLLGTLLTAQSQLPEAEQAFRRSIALHPVSSVAYTSLSGILSRQGKSDEALGVLQQGLRVRPHHALYTNLGAALFYRGRFDEAVQAYEQALATLPAGQPDVIYQANLAEALARLPGRAAAATAAYQKAFAGAVAQAAREPSRPSHASQAGLFAARLGDPVNAQRWTDTALAQAPKAVDVLFNAATASALIGQDAQARQWLDQALAKGYPAELVSQEPALARFMQPPAVAQPERATPSPRTALSTPKEKAR